MTRRNLLRNMLAGLAAVPALAIASKLKPEPKPKDLAFKDLSPEYQKVMETLLLGQAVTERPLTSEFVKYPIPQDATKPWGWLGTIDGRPVHCFAQQHGDTMRVYWRRLDDNSLYFTGSYPVQ